MHLNFKEIAEAWYNTINHSPEQKELADARFDVCLQCPNKKETIKKKEWSLICNECGCPLKSKIYTNNTYLKEGSCPLDYWKQVEEAWYKKYPNKLPKQLKNNKTLL
jgi:hypothetical protein